MNNVQLETLFFLKLRNFKVTRQIILILILYTNIKYHHMEYLFDSLSNMHSTYYANYRIQIKVMLKIISSSLDCLLHNKYYSYGIVINVIRTLNIIGANCFN